MWLDRCLAARFELQDPLAWLNTGRAKEGIAKTLAFPGVGWVKFLPSGNSKFAFVGPPFLTVNFRSTCR
jgi:hypothetical protein